MPQPTASAPPDASAAMAPQAYRWKVSGKPLAIEVRLDVVERLDQEVVRTFRAITSRGSEIGGLLLGHVRQGPEPVVVIEDYETVACDYQRGPLYLLADEDHRRLQEALARRQQASPADLRVVGYFRSNTRKELQLDDEDVAILKRYFSDPLQVCLLVKPFASKANLAGFFLWEGGEPQRKSDLTFPFNRAELTKALATSSVSASPPSTATRLSAAEPADTDGKAATAPEEVKTQAPGASRPTIEVRIAVAEEGGARFKAAATPAHAGEAAADRRPAEGVSAPAPADSKLVAPPVPAPADGRAATDGKAQPEEEDRAAGRTARHGPRLLIPADELPATTPEPEGKEPDRRPPEPGTSTRASREELEAQPGAAARPKRWRVILGVAVLALLGIGGVAIWNFSRGGAPATQPETASLDLRVERSGGQLLLSWNRSLPLLQTAQRAILSISDGDHHEDVEMDLGQLRTGSIVYSPITGDVSFRLEITDLKNGKSVSESVRVLGGRPSPTGPPAEAAGAKAEGQTSAEAPKSERQAPKTMAPIPSRDHTESLAARLSPVEPIPAAGPAVAELPTRALPVVAAHPSPPPTPEAGGAAPPASTATQPQPRPIEPASSQASTAPSAPPTPQAAAPSPAPQQVKPAAEADQAAVQAQAAGRQPESVPRVGGQVQEARLIRRREPIYPPLARQARIQGVVRLEAVIGPDGRVEKVQAISGPPLLRQAAIDAVKDWVYEPSRLNGRPVRVTTQIEINFTLGR